MGASVIRLSDRCTLLARIFEFRVIFFEVQQSIGLNWGGHALEGSLFIRAMYCFAVEIVYYDWQSNSAIWNQGGIVQGDHQSAHEHSQRPRALKLRGFSEPDVSVERVWGSPGWIRRAVATRQGLPGRKEWWRLEGVRVAVDVG
jgi:hypothetical protein